MNLADTSGYLGHYSKFVCFGSELFAKDDERTKVKKKNWPGTAGVCLVLHSNVKYPVKQLLRPIAANNSKEPDQQEKMDSTKILQTSLIVVGGFAIMLVVCKAVVGDFK